MAQLPGDDLVLCQITSQSCNDPYSIPIDEIDFEMGSLKRSSYVRCGRIFTADQAIILRRAGHITQTKVDTVVGAMITLLQSK